MQDYGAIKYAAKVSRHSRARLPASCPSSKILCRASLDLVVFLLINAELFFFPTRPRDTAVLTGCLALLVALTCFSLSLKGSAVAHRLWKLLIPQPPAPSTESPERETFLPLRRPRP